MHYQSTDWATHTLEGRLQVKTSPCVYAKVKLVFTMAVVNVKMVTFFLLTLLKRKLSKILNSTLGKSFKPPHVN